MIYATSFISFFDHEMKMGFVDADSEVEALLITLGSVAFVEDPDLAKEFNTAEKVKQLAFDRDSMVGVIPVT